MTRAILLLLSVAAVGLLTWLAAEVLPRTSAPTSQQEDPVLPAPESLALDGPRLRGRSDGTVLLDGPHGVRPPLPGDATLEEDGGYLQLTLANYDAELEGSVVALLSRPVGPRGRELHLRLRCDAAEATFYIGDFLDAAPIDTFRLAVDHPLYLPTTADVSVLGPTVRAYVSMRRSLSVQLRVRNGQGASIPGSAAALYRAAEGVPRLAPGGRHVALAIDEDDGLVYQGPGKMRDRLVLRAPTAGRYVVLIHAPGHSPVLRPLTLDAPELDLGDVVLAPGLEIAGTLRSAGRAASRGRLALAPLQTGVPFAAGGAKFQRHATGVSVGVQTTTVDHDGGFAFQGAPAGPLRLTIEGVWAPPTARALYATFARTVGAPARGLAINVPGTWVGVHVVRDGRLQAGVPVSAVEAPAREALRDMQALLRDYPWVEARTGATGRTGLVLRPGRPYLITAHDEGAEATVVALVGPPAGQRQTVRITLTEDRPTAHLAVRASGPERTPLQEMRFHLTMIAGTPALVGSTIEWPTIDATHDVFDLETLPPGRWRIRAMGPAAPTSPAHFLQTAVREFSARDGEQVQLRLTLALGGLVHVTAQDRSGAPLSAHYEVLDQDDVLQPPGWHNSPLKVFAPLAPGRYTIKASLDGYQPAREDLLIRPGRTTEVAFVLEKR